MINGKVIPGFGLKSKNIKTNDFSRKSTVDNDVF